MVLLMSRHITLGNAMLRDFYCLVLSYLVRIGSTIYKIRQPAKNVFFFFYCGQCLASLLAKALTTGGHHFHVCSTRAEPSKPIWKLLFLLSVSRAL